MNALQIAQNKDFQIIAMAEAFKILSNDTGISVESLANQFKNGNQNLIKRIGEMVAKAAEITAKELAA